MTRAILFDVYGTLISTGNGSVSAVKSILNKNGQDIDPELFYSEWKKIHKKRMRENTFIKEAEIYKKDLEELYSTYKINADYLTDVKTMLESLYNRLVYPETRDAVRRLSKSYALVIASNTDTEPLLQNFAYNNLNFDRIYTSESLETYKPSHKFYTSILNDCGYSPNEVLFVGDSIEEDIISPMQLGIPTVLIDRKKRGINVGQNYVINNLTELCELLKC